MKMTTKKDNKNKLIIPAGHFASDWFKCSNCGYEERKKIHPDQTISTCSKCGGRAYRQ
ncbi:hypothetical protein [Floccifex sp.]|uniref:hypothetical protein n=1 Tax=Floccifex sp. TaxID=2815810 RepID=UPI002A749816|nr:hypothetical protein [Floccifex sp.]MDD7280993.1 hypothetical protein [Erysipelotrichaceae bacterium]MDY2958933.1 hypothetical protein [Floccifex sp.]